MNEEFIWSVIAIIAAAIGFYAAHYIRAHKKRGSKMLCPLDSDCEAVVHSNYSEIFKIPVENLGLVYYSAVVLVYALKLVAPDFLPSYGTRAVLAITVAAFCFSIYLTGIQLFKLKEWCTWCLVSALMCLIIFVSAMAATEATLYLRYSL